MKAIVTKYIGPTNTRGSRIRASAEGVKPVSVAVSAYGSVEVAEISAAALLCSTYGWSGNLISGGLPDGRTVFVFAAK